MYSLVDEKGAIIKRNSDQDEYINFGSESKILQKRLGRVLLNRL